MPTVAVFGASGHTGRFVVAELKRRGDSTVVLSGRDAERLKAIAAATPGSEVRVATADDPASLDKALLGADAVINCAGPFVDTAVPLVDAAIRARSHYLDVTAEQCVAKGLFDDYTEQAWDAGIVITPAIAFYGGVGDLLSTAALGGSPAEADQIDIGIWLDSWHPTKGTRVTGERNAGRHVVYRNGRFEAPDPTPSKLEWIFPEPVGTQIVTDLFTPDQVTIPQHVRTPQVRVYINLAPLHDLDSADTPAPRAADESGRSPQRFMVDAVVHRASKRLRAVASGRDIYAVTAPLVVEATDRILTGRFKATGVVAAGANFDAQDFLQALSPEYLTVDLG